MKTNKLNINNIDEAKQYLSQINAFIKNEQEKESKIPVELTDIIGDDVEYLKFHDDNKKENLNYIINQLTEGYDGLFAMKILHPDLDSEVRENIKNYTKLYIKFRDLNKSIIDPTYDKLYNHTKDNKEWFNNV